jgi:integrase
MSEALTEAKVARAVKAGVPAGKTQKIEWADAPKGFGLRIRRSGSAAWVYLFRPAGVGRKESSRTLTIGAWPALSLKQAEAVAKALAGKVAIGEDPAAERRVERTRERRMLSAALDEFERGLTRRKIVNVKTILSTLRRGLQPLLKREIDTLTRADFVRRIDAIESAGKPGAAADLRKHCRSLLEWAVSRGLAPFNVLAGLRMPRASRAERLEDARKGRALSDDEVRALWVAAAALGAFGGLLRLGMLTGLRRSELAGLRWVDVRDDRIVIEAHSAKTGAKHEVPLTPAMRAVLSAQPRDTSGLVFPSRRQQERDTKLAGWSKLAPKAARASGVNFRLHDLRRTVRTLMSRLGVAEEAAEMAIGHVRRGLVGTYNKDSAWAARVEAFERVSNHVAAVITKPDDASASVVALPTRTSAL